MPPFFRPSKKPCYRKGKKIKTKKIKNHSFLFYGDIIEISP